MTSFELCDMLGIYRERLQDWVNKGYVSASFPADGAGTKADYTHRDVIKISTFKKMLELGISRKVASIAIKKWPIKTNFDVQIKEHIKAIS